MSYRRFWKQVKARFPHCHCIGMVGGFRICPHADEETCGMEISSVGNGNTRYEAWKNAADNLWRSGEALAAGPWGENTKA